MNLMTPIARRCANGASRIIRPAPAVAETAPARDQDHQGVLHPLTSPQTYPMYSTLMHTNLYFCSATTTRTSRFTDCLKGTFKFQYDCEDDGWRWHRYLA